MRPVSLKLVLVAATAVAGVRPQRARGAPEPPAPPEGGPIVIGEKKSGWKWFDPQRLEAALDFYGRSQKDKLRITGSPDITEEELLLRESLELGGELYIGHRNLFDLTGTASLGLEDDSIEGDGLPGGQHTRDTTNFYDINGRALGSSRFPFDIYTRRDEQLLDRDFASTITSTTTESGIIGSYVSERAPSTLRYFHNETDQHDQIGEFNYGYIQDSIAGQSNIRVTDTHRMEVNYTFDDISETQAGFLPNAFQRHDLSIADYITFGPKERNELRSFLRYFDQSGQFDQGTLRLDEQLQLIHSDTLETRYNLTADRQDQNGTEQELARGSALVQHKLFDSLVSTATVGGQRLTTSDNFDSDELFATGTLEYTKGVPKGLLNANVGLAINSQNNSEQGTTRTVNDEPHVFNDPLPIIVSRRNIAPGSIEVTAAGGFPTYQDGFDYTVQYFPDRAEIRPIVGRGISDGQTVLVDYDIGPEPASTIDTVGTSLAARYSLTEGALRGLSVYTIYRSQDHSIDTADPSQFVLDDATNLTYGIEYDRNGLRLRAERENHDSTVNPYDTTRLEGFLDYRLGNNSLLGLDATNETIDYTIPENRVVFTRLAARWEQFLERDLSFNVRLEYRDEQDDLGGDSQGFDQILGMHWRKNQTTVYATFRNKTLSTDTSDRTSQVLEFGLRRRF